MKRYAFIYNPAARGGKAGGKLNKLEQHIRNWPGAKLFRSKLKGDISELVTQLLPDYDVFVACGGDGTVREVASRLIGSDKSMGIIPLGTGNDLCKTLEIPVNISRSIELVKNGKSSSIDVGRCNDFYFLNSLGFGFDGLTNRYALEMNWLPPFLQYALAAFRATINQDKFKVTITTENTRRTQECIMVTLANGRVEGGSFWVAPDASVTDGKLNLITIKPISKWLIPPLLPLFLLKKAEWIPHVESSKTDEITLSFPSKPDIHADGEVIKTNKDKFTIRLIESGLRAICSL